MRIKKDNCTAKINGTITKKVRKGLEYPTMITVEYQVDGYNFEITESIKLRSEIIKLGFIPIGQKNYPVMGDTTVGNVTQVSYNPNNPREAYITYNIGIRNV